MPAFSPSAGVELGEQLVHAYHRPLYRSICPQQAMRADGVNLTRDVAETLMSALGRGGLVAEAQRLWRSMVWGRATLRPDRRTFLTAIRVFREGGALSHALHAYNGMRRAGAPREGHVPQLQHLAATGRLRYMRCKWVRAMQLCDREERCTAVFPKS